MSDDLRFIVAEVSKNWINGREVTPTGPICGLFETVVNINHGRGYRLVSFTLAQRYRSDAELIETIIAVFERLQVPDNCECRTCGHLDIRHDGGGCSYPGCQCDGWL